jgi:hypothetical protein
MKVSMKKLKTPRLFTLDMLPEFIRTQELSPNDQLDEVRVAIMYGRAIHWLSFLDILSPPFEKLDCYFIEVNYIVYNDPDRKDLPVEFYRQVADMLSMFWTLQLSNLYPNGKWKVEVFENEHMLVQADIYDRGV